MCHNSVLAWASALPPDLFTHRTVIEVGSYNINGSVRPMIETYSPASYLGVDQSAGPGVDLVADVADLPKQFPDGFDVVVTTEMLEHVEDWRAAMLALTKLVKVGGHLIISTRSPGFPYHPFPIDAWRYPIPIMEQIMAALGFDAECVNDPEAPGVFVLAKKARKVKAPKAALDAIEVPGV